MDVARYESVLNVSTGLAGEVLSCVDRWGRRIGLEELIWLTKIAVPGRIPVSCLDEVKNTVLTPDHVAFDKTHPNRECFYKAGVLPSPRHRTYLKVVVEFVEDAESGSSSGFIVTAFPAGRLHRREIAKWP